MSFRIKDLMVDVAPARFAAEHGCPNSGHTGKEGCPNSGPPGKDGCPNSGGPTATCPPPDTREGCPNSGPGTTKSPGRKRAGSAAALPELRRQLHEALNAASSAQAWV
jgi:hypothetical protein